MTALVLGFGTRWGCAATSGRTLYLLWESWLYVVLCLCGGTKSPSDSDSESGGGTLTGELTLLGTSWRTRWGEALSPPMGRSGRTLYLVSGRGLSLRGGGEALRSESDSDTGRRGREALEECREVVQLGPTGEDWGFGRVDIPERDLYLLA